MKGWTQALARTRSAVSRLLGRMRGRRLPDASEWEDIEEGLLGADVSAALVAEWVDRLEDGNLGDASPREALEQILLQAFPPVEPFSWADLPRPAAILVVGVNGSGKTTTCAKLARMAAAEGRTPLLAAADTFRAAGSDQMRLWAERLGVDVVSGQTGGDAASVTYDAAEALKARNRDLLIVDTAGRMHTREPLMRELDKIKRALGKSLPGEPRETWIVLDASLGQNAIHQARFFHQASPLTGGIVAKLDGSSKAGFVFSVVRELGIPIRYAGLGESADDLAPFDPVSFTRAMFDEEEADADGKG